MKEPLQRKKKRQDGKGNIRVSSNFVKGKGYPDSHFPWESGYTLDSHLLPVYEKTRCFAFNAEHLVFVQMAFESQPHYKGFLVPSLSTNDLHRRKADGDNRIYSLKMDVILFGNTTLMKLIRMMLQRNLLYTGLTGDKRVFVVCNGI